MRIFTRRLAIVAALVGVALMASSAEACHKRLCGGGRTACAGGGYGGGGYGGYAGGGYGDYPGMASYQGSPYGGTTGMASYPSVQSGAYTGMTSYPAAPYGQTMVGSPYAPGMPVPGSYSSAYGTMPAGTVAPGVPLAPVPGGAIPVAPAPAAHAIPAESSGDRSQSLRGDRPAGRSPFFCRPAMRPPGRSREGRRGWWPGPARDVTLTTSSQVGGVTEYAHGAA